MNQKNRFRPTAGAAALLAAFMLGLASLACGASFDAPVVEIASQEAPGSSAPAQVAAPTFTFSPPKRTAEVIADTEGQPQQAGLLPNNLVELHKRMQPGVVNINTLVTLGDQSGQAVGSGFILDDQGHIVTNNHVIAGANQVTVIFFNGLEVPAEVIGTDDDSDLAVLDVPEYAEGAYPLPLADSDRVEVGEWVIAIGNPFGLGGSMSAGIVSAIGRTIASGVTPFSIPQTIQTDAAINPGNSGGPLINLKGEVIGVNAQIATDSGVRANAGVGFAIASNVVRRVAPALIKNGSYDWPWLGVTGAPLNQAIIRANNLDVQAGAYIDSVVTGGPADQAGLRGSSGLDNNGIPRGGDVVVAVDGQAVANFDDLLAYISSKSPGEQIVLTVVRRGERRDVPLRLEARPQNFGPEEFNP